MSEAVHQLEAGMPPVATPAKKEGRYNLILMTDDDPGIFVFEMSEAQAESLASTLGGLILRAKREWLEKLETKK
ncbi:hypothetical protein [Pyramidobacter sp.]|uniref:hypothetical protein n=1 Tax=Pyramidobacter sp. TaxID=1943581 RepID=UPI00331FB46C